MNHWDEKEEFPTGKLAVLGLYIAVGILILTEIPHSIKRAFRRA